MMVELGENSGVIYEEDVPVRMRDGVTLRCNVFRPADGKPAPALIQRQPYNKNAAQCYVYAHPAWYAWHGYVTIVEDSRGRYASEGTFYPLRHDAVDGYDTIEWAAAQPWCNGKIASFGFSIPGVNQLLAASERPPHLVTAMPGFYPQGMYEGFTHVGGTFGLAAVMDWAMLLSTEAARRARDPSLLPKIRAVAACVGRWNPTLSLREIPFLLEPTLMPFLSDYFRHPLYDAYWQDIELGPRAERIDIPCLHISGWYDSFITQTIEAYERFVALGRADHRLFVGPWYHIPWTQQVGCIDFGDDAKNLVDEVQLAWLDAHLKGKREALERIPPVRIFVTGENRWRDSACWPLPGTQSASLYLHSQGRANSLSGNGTLSWQAPGTEPPDFYVYGPEAPVQSAGGHSCCMPQNTPMGPADQAGVELRNDVLVYTSTPLDQPLFVAGKVTAVVHAATTAHDTDWVVKLCDVSPDGRSINLQEGVVRARYRDGATVDRPIEPNRVYEYRLSVGVVCHRFKPGHRLRVQVTSSNFPAWDRNPNTGDSLGSEPPFGWVVANQTIFHDGARPSRLELPIIRG